MLAERRYRRVRQGRARISAELCANRTRVCKRLKVASRALRRSGHCRQSGPRARSHSREGRGLDLKPGAPGVNQRQMGLDVLGRCASVGLAKVTLLVINTASFAVAAGMVGVGAKKASGTFRQFVTADGGTEVLLDPFVTLICLGSVLMPLSLTGAWAAIRCACPRRALHTRRDSDGVGSPSRGASHTHTGPDPRPLSQQEAPLLLLLGRAALRHGPHLPRHPLQRRRGQQ